MRISIKKIGMSLIVSFTVVIGNMQYYESNASKIRCEFIVLFNSDNPFLLIPPTKKMKNFLSRLKMKST